MTKLEKTLANFKFTIVSTPSEDDSDSRDYRKNEDFRARKAKRKANQEAKKFNSTLACKFLIDNIIST